MRAITTIVGFTTIISCHTFGQHSRHGAHLHGIGELTVAVEKSAIEMIFTAPAVSIVGFESKAVNSDQLQAVEDAKLILRDPSRLVTFVGKQCDLIEVAVDLTAISGSDTLEHDEDHDEDHSDISVRYEFECSNDSKLKKLRFGPDGLLFELDKVNVMWVSEAGQGAAEVTSEQLVIELD